MTGPAGVCVFSERQDVVLELLAVGRDLAEGGRLVSVATGPDGQAQAAEQIACGADEVYLIDTIEGADAGDNHVEALRQVLEQARPDILVVGATSHGTDVAARLAQSLGLGCAGECTTLKREGGQLIVERACLGRFVSRQAIDTRPALATVRPRRFKPKGPDASRSGKLQRLSIDVAKSRAPVVSMIPRKRSAVAIEKANVVVAVGRGLKSREDLRMIEELARALGGVVGASRPLTDDLEWLSPDVKVGLSGASVKPRLYVACGISGQIEHNVGMRESGVVIAINTDPQAPIMRQADYCLVGDLHEIVPALTREVDRLLSR